MSTNCAAQFIFTQRFLTPRAWLCEHLATAAARLTVAAHDAEGRLHFVAASELSPAAPAIELGGGGGGGGAGGGRAQ